jgi:hypothetical protein
MAFRLVFAVLLSAVIFACNPDDKEYPDADEVPGVYINTYSVDVIDPQTGEVMGARTVRDTIFIKFEGDGYEVANRKWLLNDYDEQGWVDSMQGEIDPMETYRALYDLKTGVLRPSEEDNKNHKPPLFLEDEKIYWGDLRALEYSKVR